MIWKKVFGNPFDTQAVVIQVKESEIKYFSIFEEEKQIIFSYQLSKDEVVYGLGETMGRVNKRGGRYISFNNDTADHSDTNPSLYSSHNFLIVDGSICFGIFFDTPGRVIFEIDYENSGQIKVVCETPDLNVWQIESKNAYEVAKEFLRAIGPCYIPPLWAFGYGQSRFGYQCEQDFFDVIEGHHKAGIPLDYVCMDIGYMDRFADFTVNRKRFPNLKGFVDKVKAQGVHLVPIVDAGIKVEKGNKVYTEGIKNAYFCRNKEGGFFKAGVWPGMTHFPDFLNSEARQWFGDQYRFYTDCGIDGFWNDMNEPAIFYSEYTKGPKKLSMILDIIFSKQREAKKQKNLLRDYKSFFHNADGKRICHYDVHNIYGYLMTRATSEGLSRLLPNRFLLFSRSSYIGAGRYGGVWTGDNSSCWEHLMLNIRHMPSLNMCGFLYSGADTGGFMGNCTRELLLRWLAVSVFTPLMRNHSSMGTRRQECYQFGNTGDFRSVISLRYRLLPYIYSEYMKAALTGDMYIKPLAFRFPEDRKARIIEDQLIVGESIMMTPIVREGEAARTVYLPEEMTMIKYDGSTFTCTPAAKGETVIHAELNEVIFFILKGRLVPVGKPVSSAVQMNFEELTFLGDGSAYSAYVDDGLTREYTLDNLRILVK